MSSQSLQPPKNSEIWKFCQPQRHSATILLDIWCTGTQQCQLASSEMYTTGSHKSPGILPLVWSLGLSGLITQPSSVSTRTWFHLHKDIGLDCRHCGAWNKNEIGYWLVSFPGSRVPYKSLGMRLAVDQRHTVSDTFPSVFAYCKAWEQGNSYVYMYIYIANLFSFPDCNLGPWK